MGTLSILGVILAIAVIIFLAYKNHNSFVIAFIGALIIIMTSRMDFWSAVNTFMTGASGFVTNYGLMLIVGSIYGIVLDKTNCAKSLAFGILKVFGKERCILAAMLSVTLLAFSGLSAFVIIFTVYPILLYMFSEANLSKGYITAVVLWGASVAQQCLPAFKPLGFALYTQPYLNNSVYPANGLACILTAISFIATYAYFKWTIKRDQARGIVFVPSKGEVILSMEELYKKENIPSFAAGIVNVVVMCITSMIFNSSSFIGYFNGSGVNTVTVSLLISTIILMLQFKNNLFKANEYTVKKILTEGFTGVLNAIFATAGFIAFANILQASAAFPYFVSAVDFISKTFNGYVGASVSVIICSGICVSSLGGLLVFLGSMVQPFLSMGLNPDALTRVLSISACGLDTLPWCACIAVYNDVAGIELKGTYKHTFWTCCALPIALGILSSFLAAVMY